MIGPILIIIGLYWFWALFHGKAGAMWNAITGDSGFDARLDSFANAITPTPAKSSNPNNKTTAPITANADDSGTHMGIDSNGNIVTINSTYANMTPDQKDAANNYAHSIGNV